MTELLNLKQDEARALSAEQRFDIRERIHTLEAALSREEQLHVEIINHFSKGVYAREMRLPAGALIVGKIHKYVNLNILSAGEVSVISVDGVLRVKAPYTVVASPGAKRTIFAHEDSVWTTIHGTEETDLSLIERQFIAQDYSEVYEASERTFSDVLEFCGITAELMQEISECEEDQCSFPESTEGVTVLDSPTHGKGLFATADLKSGEMICLARTADGLRTPAGRYCNHSGKPNAEMCLSEDGSVHLRALTDINTEAGPIELLTDYYYNHTNTRG